tara:strand:- start:8511 stop:9227 length:717 start_codon:yes stop_codon:yes gene_type:complete
MGRQARFEGQVCVGHQNQGPLIYGYGNFIKAIRGMFGAQFKEGTRYCYVRFRFEAWMLNNNNKGAGGGFTPWVKLDRCNLYVKQIITSTQQINFPVTYGDANVDICYESFYRMYINLVKAPQVFAESNNVDVRLMKLLAFMIAEAARFEVIEMCVRRCLYEWFNIDWDTWKPLLNSWEAIGLRFFNIKRVGIPPQYTELINVYGTEKECKSVLNAHCDVMTGDYLKMSPPVSPGFLSD